MADDNQEALSNVQANDHSAAIGKIEVGGDLSGNVVVGGELHIHINDSKDVKQDSIFYEFVPESFEPATLLISEGPVLLPDSEKEGVPLSQISQQEFKLKAYRIGKKPVTNSQFEEFVIKADRPVTTAMHWEGRKVPEGLEDHPVLGITWDDALNYCKWLGEQTKRNYSLPTFAQLEKAYQISRDIEDVENMIHQWTCTLWGEKQKIPDLKYRFPWKDDGRNKLDANNQIRRVVCVYKKMPDTGSFKLESRVGKFPDDAGLPGVWHGFRVVINR